MSKINLPELPFSPYLIRDPIPPGATPRPMWTAYSAEQMTAYAEQAVREALAAQKPVAWMTEDGRVSTDVTKRTAMPNASQGVFSIPLAIIPENDHVEGADQQHP